MGKTDQNIYTSSDAIVKELENAGVEVIYGIVSIHNMPIYDAITRSGKIKLIAARGESGAVNMADGYARSTGKIGVVLTSTGAGAGNGAGSLTEAWNAGTPLLHLTGEVATDFIGTGQRFIHECKDQLQMMKGASKEAYSLEKPEQAGLLIQKAIREATTVPLGPVTVQIPTDLQTLAVPQDSRIYQQELRMEDTLDLDSAVNKTISDEIISKIANAKRPIIWAGGGSIDAGASDAVKQLVELIQPAVLTSESAKGIIPEDHALCIGNYTDRAEVVELVGKSDLVISIGTHFRQRETSNWTLPLPKEHINIDADPKAFNRNYEMSYGLVGDAKYFLQKMNKALAKQSISSDADYVSEIKSVKNKIYSDLRKDVEPYTQFADGIRRILPGNSILVRDVTMPAYIWGNKLIDILQPRTSMTIAGGGIGQGLPLAIGAQMKDKEAVVVLMAGDGGFMINVGEMVTAVEEELPLIVILFNDSGYGILRYLQDSAYGRRAGVDLFSPNFSQLAKSMGFEAEDVGSVDEFVSSMESAVLNRKPTMIVVDMDAIGPMNKLYSEPEAIINSYRPKES